MVSIENCYFIIIKQIVCPINSPVSDVAPVCPLGTEYRVQSTEKLEVEQLIGKAKGNC